MLSYCKKMDKEAYHELYLHRRRLRDQTNPFELPNKLFRKLYR